MIMLILFAYFILYFR